MSMYLISATQIKMARAMLDWSQEVLAEKTRLSISTIRSLELGFAPRPSTAKEIRTVIEAAGIEFTDGEGIRRKCELAIVQGQNSGEKIFDDILDTLKQKNEELTGFIRSPNMLMQSLGVANKGDLHRMERLFKSASVKCVVADSTPAQFALPPFQFRILSQADSSESYFYTYGNKQVIVIPRDNGSFHFVVMSLSSQAQRGRNRFQEFWNKALPLLASNAKK